MKVVFWDFDGTLGYRERGWTGALHEALSEGHPELGITFEQSRGLLQTGFPWHTPDVPHPETTEPSAWWAKLEPVFARAYARLGLNKDQADRLATTVRGRYMDPAMFRLFPDTLAALDAVYRNGWSQALFTNHVPEIERIVDALGLSAFFAQVITSGETGYEKPHPQAYAIALARMGSPDNAWMIGDNCDADILGAEKAGMRAILVRREDSRATRQLPDLTTIHTLLR